MGTSSAEIAAELKSRLPGYAVPRYVKEIPGASGKVPVRLTEGALRYARFRTPRNAWIR